MAYSTARPTQMNGVNGAPYPVQTEGSRITTNGLRDLQSDDEKRLFDIVDRLRELDVNHELELPQLVVCGSQSSGKSSVLEAISELPFPRGDGICTRFVTELQFRRHHEEKLELQIIPDPSRDPQKRHELSQIRAISQDLQQLPRLIAETSQRIEIGRNRNFARDVLKIQISGPNYQPLTLVDLPGMIDATSAETKEDKPLLDSIVNDWISQSRSVILAVVEANLDAQRNPILERVKQFDPFQERTFGIITKPDADVMNSKRQQEWVNRVMSSGSGKQDFDFKKGWHILRNRKSDEIDSSTADRDRIEREFFNNPKNIWSRVRQNNWGIETLRKRLRELLYEHTKSQLPQVRSDIKERLKAYNDALEDRKARLHRPQELYNKYLTECKKLNVVASKGTSGEFDDHEFYTGQQTQAAGNPRSRYLRARIQFAHDNFANEMTNSYEGYEAQASLDSGTATDKHDFISNLLSERRGPELPGQFNPKHMNPVFHAASTFWYSTAERHIDQSYAHCQEFIEQLIKVYLAGRLTGVPSALCYEIYNYVDDLLEKQRKKATEELKSLESDRKRRAVTRNKHFEKLSRRSAGDNLFVSTMRLANAEQSNGHAVNGGDAPMLTPGHIQNVSRVNHADTAVEKIGMDAAVYYDIARDVFIDNVIIQVVERHLLTPLEGLFESDFGIDSDKFLKLCNKEDKRALEAEMKDLDGKVARLKEFLSELPSS